MNYAGNNMNNAGGIMGQMNGMQGNNGRALGRPETMVSSPRLGLFHTLSVVSPSDA